MLDEARPLFQAVERVPDALGAQDLGVGDGSVTASGIDEAEGEDLPRRIGHVFLRGEGVRCVCHDDPLYGFEKVERVQRKVVLIFRKGVVPHELFDQTHFYLLSANIE